MNSGLEEFTGGLSNITTLGKLAFDNIVIGLLFYKGGHSRATKRWKVHLFFQWHRFQSRARCLTKTTLLTETTTTLLVWWYTHNTKRTDSVGTSATVLAVFKMSFNTLFLSVSHKAGVFRLKVKWKQWTIISKQGHRRGYKMESSDKIPCIVC